VRNLRAYVGLLALLLAACSSHGAGLVPSVQSAAVARNTVAKDLGRRSPQRIASVTLVLKYRNAAALDRFVAQLAKSHGPHFLTRQEFLDRYAPTVAQEQHVVDVLRAAGLTVTHRYANHTVIDASGATRNVERLFATEIHDFSQGRHGTRFANVKPLVIPSKLASLVLTANADTIVHVRPGTHVEDPVLDTPVSDPHTSPAIVPDISTGNIIQNAGFESGALSPWQGCHTSTAPVGKLSTFAHTGSFSALTGSLSKRKGEVNGLSCVWQEVTVPTQGILSAYVYRSTNDTNKKNAGQFIALYAGTTQKFVAELFSSHKSSGWTKVHFNLAKYAGKQMWIAFGVYGSSADTGKFVGMYIDDVSLVGTAPSTGGGCTPGATPPPDAGGNGGWGPNSTADGFLLPSIECYTGQGQTVAIAIDSAPATTDVSAYMSYYGITRTGTITVENVDGGDAFPSADSLGESTLDVETIASLAPAANVIVYELPGLDDQSIEDGYNLVLSDGHAAVVNSSFGGCESDTTFAAATNVIAQQGAATGVTFSASAGDTGVQCYTSTVGASAPASGTFFVAVGGTQSTSTASGAYYSGCGIPTTPINNPVVWNDCVGAGGGGVSVDFTPLPSFQTGLTTAGGRSVPDISLPAAGTDIMINGSWETLWGTSWASPIYSAMQAEINQECNSDIWGITALYGAFAKDPTYQNAFIDVTSGNDSFGGSTGFTAGTGFDTASGIGMPMGVNVAYDACGAGSIVTPAARR
jgi:Pro-kumamolisin, activation domain/Subtilase family